VIRRGAAEEDRKVLKIKGQDVTVRRFSEPPREAEVTATDPKRRSTQKTDHTKRPSGGRAKPSRSTGTKERSRSGSRSRDRRPSRPHLEVVTLEAELEEAGDVRVGQSGQRARLNSREAPEHVGIGAVAAKELDGAVLDRVPVARIR
jgi:hypothetical protein